MAGDYEKALAHAKAGRLEAAQSILLGLEDERSERLLVKVNAAIAARGGVRQKPSEAEVLQLKKEAQEKPRVKAKTEPAQKQKQQAYALLLVLVVCGLCYAMSLSGQKSPASSPVVAADDASGQEALISQTIRSITDIDLQSVQVLHREDGYDLIIIGYTSHATTSADLYSEYGYVFGAVGTLVKQQGWDFDDLGMVVGNTQGFAIKSVSVQMSDVIAFLDGQISVETLAERMTITDF
jgi:hypothetical protein